MRFQIRVMPLNNHEYINYQEVPSLLRVRSMAISSSKVTLPKKKKSQPGSVHFGNAPFYYT